MYSNGPGYVEPRANLTSVDLGTYAFFVISYLLANVTTEMTIWDTFVSLDIAVIQWITSCHKNPITTRVIILWRVAVTSLTTSMSTMRFHIELLFILNPIRVI